MSPKIATMFPQFPSGLPAREWLVARVKQAEALGFESFFVGERPLTPSGMLDPFTLLGYLSAHTERMMLGTGVVLLPLHQPVLVAKAAASVDVLSGGRFILGVAPGGDFTAEFEACGVPHNQRGGRTEEAIVLMRRLWSEDTVDHEGRYFQVRGGTIDARPVQPGGPAIWIGGRGDWAVRCAGRLGDAWIPSFMPANRYRESWQRIGDLAIEAGRDPSAIVGAINLPFYIGQSFEQAWPVAAAHLGQAYKRTYDASFMKRYGAVGSADDCREMVGLLAEAGVQHFVLMPCCATEEFEEQFALTAEALIAPSRVVAETRGG